jgi:protein arginine kinase activator
MLCENCGNNKATVKFTQIINGDKKEMNLCSACADELGIGNMDFNMPINFSSFFGDFLEDFSNNPFMTSLGQTDKIKCDKCGLTFDDFIKSGKIGCSKCYDTFQNKIDPILKQIHGSNTHIGRLGKINANTKLENIEYKENKQESKIEKLKKDLKQAINEERYEDAALLRDEIKKEES